MDLGSTAPIDCSDIYDRDMQKIFRALKAYGPYGVSILILVYLLTDSTKNFLHIYTAVIFLGLGSYFYHRFLHILPVNAINAHIYVHHSPHKTISRTLDLILEMLPPIVYISSLLLLQEFVNIHIVPHNVAFLGGLYYMSYHIINYSIFGSSFHEKHHKYKNVNFTPDFCDHIFGTNATEEFEDMSHMIPNIIVSYLVTCYLFNM